MGCACSHAAVEASDVVSAATPKGSDAPGRGFHKEFILNEKLGQGAFAVVYAATHKHSSSEQFAVKVADIRGQLNKDHGIPNQGVRPDRRRELMVMNEAAILTTVCGHENVCHMSERFIEDGLAYLVLERYDRTLFEALESVEMLNEETLRPFLQGMLSGLAAVHARRIVHRDVKPDNFMCSGPLNTVKLCDFGLACALPPPGSEETTPQCTGIVGTAPYMSPDVLKDRGYGTKVDVWSFGVVVHVLLCGRFPYIPQEMNARSMKAAILSGVPTPKIFMCPPTSTGMSAEARHLIIGALSRSSRKRPTCREALQDEFFTSQSLSQVSLRRKLEAAKRGGAFDDTGVARADVGEVDVWLRQLQDRSSQGSADEKISTRSEVSTAACSRASDGDRSNESAASR